MAHLISEERIVPTWVAAIRLLENSGPQLRNILLEVESPSAITGEDQDVIASVDAALRTHSDLSVNTVAATIFPQAMYRRHGCPALYEEFLSRIDKAKVKNTWGTYAMRIMRRKGRDGKPVNPLDQIVEKLRRSGGEGVAFQAVYELGVYEPSEDLDEGVQGLCELPLFDVARDGSMVTNMPCLSHLSFKKSAGSVDLTAVYRSHYYCARAIGNLVGLAQLLGFVARESGHEVGTLTCLSTHAVLDTRAWGAKSAFRSVFDSLPD